MLGNKMLVDTTQKERSAIRSALDAVYTCKWNAEDRGNSHGWDDVINTLKELLKKFE